MSVLTQEQIADTVNRLRDNAEWFHWDCEIKLKAADMLEQLAAERGKIAGVRVKGLVWGRAEKSGMNLQSDCPFGRYYIALRGEYGFMWWRPASGPAHMDIEPTEEAAKAAAQADYETRILAALEPAPDTRSYADGLEDAERACLIVRGQRRDTIAIQTAEQCAAAIRALQEKDHE